MLLSGMSPLTEITLMITSYFLRTDKAHPAAQNTTQTCFHRECRLHYEQPALLLNDVNQWINIHIINDQYSNICIFVSASDQQWYIFQHPGICLCFHLLRLCIHFARYTRFVFVIKICICTDVTEPNWRLWAGMVAQTWCCCVIHHTSDSWALEWYLNSHARVEIYQLSLVQCKQRQAP